MSAARSSSTLLNAPFDNGDRLTRVEFHRRYETAPDLKKAELIEGVVYLGSPVRIEHSNAEGELGGWLATYRASVPGLEIPHNGTVVLDEDNEFQPDIMLRRSDGGTSRGEDGYVHGGPELVVEIAASSISRDLHAKKNVYRRNRVQEYIVWRVLDGELDWFALHEGEYRLLTPDKNGVIHSEVFPGLRLAVAKLLAGDFAAVMSEQQRPA
jgi:Uma2 family endonuclease